MKKVNLFILSIFIFTTGCTFLVIKKNEFDNVINVKFPYWDARYDNKPIVKGNLFLENIDYSKSINGNAVSIPTMLIKLRAEKGETFHGNTIEIKNR